MTVFNRSRRWRWPSLRADASTESARHFWDLLDTVLSLLSWGPSSSDGHRKPPGWKDWLILLGVIGGTILMIAIIIRMR